jgi:hypothetical protein
MHARIPPIDRRGWLKLSSASTAAVVFGSIVSTSDAGPVADAVTWLDCSFGPLHDRQRVRWLLMIVGNRIERGVVEPLGTQAVDVSRLRIDGGRITEHITIAHDPILNSRSIPRSASRMPITLDLTITGTQIRGTWPKNAKSTIEGADLKGDVTGTIISICRFSWPAKAAAPSARAATSATRKTRQPPTFGSRCSTAPAPPHHAWAIARDC